MTAIRNLIFALLTCCSVGMVGAAETASTAPVSFSIKRQSLQDALTQFGRQSGYQLLFLADITAEVIAPEVVGKFTPRDALEQLLDNSGLQFRFVNERTIAISETKTAGIGAAGQISQDLESARAVRLAQVESTSSAPDATQSASQAEGRPDSAQLEEVVVTAQKRVERLLDVPQAVTVLSSEALSKLGATQFRDFANTVPGLNFNSAGAGYTSVSMRGVTMGIDLTPTVGIYVDEVPYGSSGAFARGSRLALDVGLFDIDRIEVLRGPQGTLYGASSMGGLLKYVTKSPSKDGFSGYATTGISSTEQGGVSYNGAAAVNMPVLGDRAALRVSGFYSHDGGYIDNVELGQNDVNQSDVYGGRADFLIEPNDALSVRLTAFGQNISRDGLGVADFTYSGSPVDGDLEQRRLIAEPFEQRFRSASATVTYDFDWATLTSISSYQTVNSQIGYDLSPLWVPTAALFDLFVSAAGYLEELETKKFVQETRLVSGGSGPVGWVVGGFYSHESSPNSEGFIFRDLAGQPMPNTLFLAFRDPLLYEEYAAFGDVTWKLNEQFDLTGGLRYAHSRSEITQTSFGTFGGAAISQASSDDIFTYLANARYHFSDHATMYVRYATGYRPGGANTVATDPVTGEPFAPPTFEADRLKSYEIGFKGETGDRRFGIELAAYDIDWDNIQVLNINSGFGEIDNASGGARVRGGELALTARPVSALTMLGSVALQDAELSADEPNLGAAAGERLPDVPRVTVSFNADYTFQTGLRPTIGLTARHVSDRRAGFDASTTQPQYLIPDYTMFDVRAGLTLGAVNAQLFVRNISDERGQLSTYTWNRIWAQPGILQPRTVGLMATLQF